MSDAGVPLIAGTDAPAIPGLAPGFSLHDDLADLVSAGLSRYEALATATRTPGAFVRTAHPDADRFGIVAPGYRADLVLTAANPLEDLGTLRTPVGVMAAGVWRPASELQSLLDSVVAGYLPATRSPGP
jgi:imidazolonepropionase-like amidohydrolase